MSSAFRFKSKPAGSLSLLVLKIFGKGRERGKDIERERGGMV
jgi:hypothetical protein